MVYELGINIERNIVLGINIIFKMYNLLKFSGTLQSPTVNGEGFTIVKSETETALKCPGYHIVIREDGFGVVAVLVKGKRLSIEGVVDVCRRVFAKFTMTMTGATLRSNIPRLTQTSMGKLALVKGAMSSLFCEAVNISYTGMFQGNILTCTESTCTRVQVAESKCVADIYPSGRVTVKGESIEAMQACLDLLASMV